VNIESEMNFELCSPIIDQERSMQA